MIKLFLDDIRIPSDIYESGNWETVRSYDKFVEYVNLNFDDISSISLDHDLGLDEFGEIQKTGYDCIKWLINYCMDTGKDLPKIWCHSMNPVGRANILGIVNSYLKQINN
jgi:hypothetical protein